jgi:uncharacterized protein
MRARTLVLVVAGFLGFMGCVSLKRTPEARFFVLRSLVEAPAPAAETGQIPGEPLPPGLVGVLPVFLPGYLDRPQVVTWTAPGELRIDEFLRWAEPLDVGVARVLSESLGTLLPSHRVIRAPWSSAAPLRCRVRLELTRFGPQESGEMVLTGRWALLSRQGERPLLSRPVSLRGGPTPSATDAGAGVEAMSALLAELSREIAAAILALPAEELAEEGPNRDNEKTAGIR